LDDLVALIVMAEDDDAPPELRLGGGNARVHLLVEQSDVALRQRLPLGEMLFFVGSQNRERRRHVRSACEIFLNLWTRKSQAPVRGRLKLGVSRSITLATRRLFPAHPSTLRVPQGRPEQRRRATGSG